MDRAWHHIFACRVVVLILAVISYLSCQVTCSTSIATDQSALLSLKSHISLDPNNIVTTNWTNSTPVCSWVGVTCSSRHYRVAGLDISHMDLRGTIPPHLGNLSFLVSLNVSYNYFSGNLPLELSWLRRLKVFNTSVNNFTGDIPKWLGLLPKLKHLFLRNNSFTGFIPSSLSNMSNLETLDFSYNPLQGTIPKELGNFPKLRVLALRFNHLSGPIPPSIFNVSTLESIGFTSNQLNGNLPFNMCHQAPFLEELKLSDNQLSGQILSTVIECSQLRILSLSYNHFSGKLSDEIARLQNLEVLYIGFNNITGVIPPSIGSLQKLVGFSVAYNQITGTIPPNIFNMSSLQVFDIYTNYVMGGIPREIGNITTLTNLQLSNNKLTGVIPEEISQLNQLEELSMSYNNMSGTIPPGIFNMSTLQILSLASCGMTGGLSSTIGYGLPIIEYFYLSENSLTGEIPHSLSNCSKLKRLSLHSNKFTGFLPHFFGDLRLLEKLRLNNNSLRIQPSSSESDFFSSLANCRFLSRLFINSNPIKGFIPSSIGNVSNSITVFSAYNCEFKGSIPAEIGNLTKLIKIDLGHNELIGSIPSTFEHLQELQALYLPNNSIVGFIPEFLRDSHRLVILDFSQNQFLGSIPVFLGNISSLRHLYLDSNMLTSTIPQSLWGLKDLIEINFSSNSLSGHISPGISNLVTVSMIDLSMNKFSGNIPSTIGKLQSLRILSLAHNELQGSIPVSVGNMISLEVLDLSHNNLNGSIPKSMEGFKYLRSFNVSFNSLTGEIPSGGPFRNFTKESFKANEALCGNTNFQVQPCHTISRHGSTMKRARLALFISTGVLTFISVFSLTVILMTRSQKKEKAKDDEITMPELERISYYELQRATEGFSEKNLLGSGSFGFVYKATMRDGKILAIKVFNLQSEGVSKSFDVECEVLRNIRHRNLTKVLGCCSNEDFKALILEFMVNGNLDDLLYSHNYCVDFMQRLNIMIDVASALEYLHHGYSMPIVHCDLKPSNVLLDGDMVAHLSDFGIAKLLGEENYSTVTNTLATIGYIAPEYGFEGLVSTKCDVYSYGIMLMESFTCKRPSDKMFGGNLSLKGWVESLLPESLDRIIDVNLLEVERTNLGDHNHKILQCVSSILELALKCSADLPKDRINMKDALADLQKTKHRFLAR